MQQRRTGNCRLNSLCACVGTAPPCPPKGRCRCEGTRALATASCALDSNVPEMLQHNLCCATISTPKAVDTVEHDSRSDG